jgi:uncharacterized protein (TIGR03643 family)
MIPDPIDPSTSHIIGLAWADDVPFERIKNETGLSEADVIKIMRRHLKPNSFKRWRTRVSGRRSKHEKRAENVQRLEE